MKDSETRQVVREDAVTDNTWRRLGTFTDARIGLGRAGPSQTTKDVLAFQLAHARAQDAVKTPVSWQAIKTQLQDSGMPFLHLHSQAHDRACYLQRPDLGRRLSVASQNELKAWQNRQAHPKLDFCIVLADGLSATAVEMQAPSMLKQLLIDSDKAGFERPLICLVDQARVAIGDEIAEILNARFMLVMIGERPGLSSPNSLGIYFSYQAKRGFNDAQRNCLSNIRPEGLGFAEASRRLLWLMAEANTKKLSGVMLKDESMDKEQIASNKQPNLLTANTNQ